MKKIIIAILLILAFTPLTKAQRYITPKDSATRDMKPVPGKAIVYIIRPSNVGYQANPYIEVHCDDNYLGRTDFTSYLYTILTPGSHTFISRAENKVTLELTVEAGKIYYIEQQIKMGFTNAPRIKLELISEGVAKEFMKKCVLSPVRNASLDL